MSIYYNYVTFTWLFIVIHAIMNNYSILLVVSNCERNPRRFG